MSRCVERVDERLKDLPHWRQRNERPPVLQFVVALAGVVVVAVEAVVVVAQAAASAAKPLAELHFDVAVALPAAEQLVELLLLVGFVIIQMKLIGSRGA